MKLSDLNILDIGHAIQITGLVLSGHGNNFVIHFPGEGPKDPSVRGRTEPYSLIDELDTTDWVKLLYQSDMLEVELIGPKKAIVRKSQRQIDTNVSWAVFKRDGYRCRYCDKECPLTVDHIILWEAGGPSVEANLLAACKKCNRTRGNMEYTEWMASPQYVKLSAKLDQGQLSKNLLVLGQLTDLEAMKVSHVRSR